MGDLHIGVSVAAAFKDQPAILGAVAIHRVEADRRRAFHNGGSMPWQLNEPYPNGYCTSAIDYFARPKPLYYAVARAYEPLHLSARFDSQVWAGNASFAAQVWLSVAGEYGVALRPLNKNKKFSASAVQQNSGDGLLFNSVWAFSVQ